MVSVYIMYSLFYSKTSLEVDNEWIECHVLLNFFIEIVSVYFTFFLNSTFPVYVNFVKYSFKYSSVFAFGIVRWVNMSKEEYI